MHPCVFTIKLKIYDWIYQIIQAKSFTIKFLTCNHWLLPESCKNQLTYIVNSHTGSIEVVVWAKGHSGSQELQQGENDGEPSNIWLEIDKRWGQINC